MQIEVRKPTKEEIKETESWGEWSKEESEFDWSYSDQETCYILEGSATVTPKDGEPASFDAGDLVIFPAGMECVWKIDKAIRKKYKFG